jgi:transcriptional regulator of heat shock response
MFKQPEFIENPMTASQVLEVFEHSDNFINTIKSLNVGSEIKAFIGEENILPQIQSCSIIAATYEINGFKGHFGILGPKRMRYPFNIAMLEQIKNLLENN